MCAIAQLCQWQADANQRNCYASQYLTHVWLDAYCQCMSDVLKGRLLAIHCYVTSRRRAARWNVYKWVENRQIYYFAVGCARHPSQPKQQHNKSQQTHVTMISLFNCVFFSPSVNTFAIRLSALNLRFAPRFAFLSYTRYTHLILEVVDWWDTASGLCEMWMNEKLSSRHIYGYHSFETDLAWSEQRITSDAFSTTHRNNTW